MLTGAHMSIAGGVDTSVARGIEVGCRTMQIFTKNANQWTAAPIHADTARRFREELDRSGIGPVVSHDSYLINLGSPDLALREKSMAAFVDELDRAEQLGLVGVVTHPGAHMGQGEEAGLERVAASLRAVLKTTHRHKVAILIENTAGQGTSLGWAVSHLATLLAGVEGHSRIGFCLDTCHLHAAGHDLSTDASYGAFIEAFDAAVGLDRLRCFHMNDSLKPFGSRVDRHTHIGQGTIGEEPFRRIMCDTRLAHVPKILETPKVGSGVTEDRMNLATLARLGTPPAPARKRKAG
ncbi:MAG TPA: deoxyribonuclease IV [Candidatus Eisenbacteria bacterium]